LKLKRGFQQVTYIKQHLFSWQDYLGGVIVFMSVVAALLTVNTYPDVTPSLVGLAVNYTLLVPIYLNWVVKFLADMEMYMGAVERVQQYALTPTEDYRLQGK
jgi:ATP-binding cassette subfamily C (CFTR/MRP) protein 8